jgi:magnesium chelatase subunit I
VLLDYTDKKYKDALDKVAGLQKAVEEIDIDKADFYTFMELVLHGLSEFEALNKEFIHTKLIFKDFLASNMRGLDDEDEEETNLRDMF